MRLLFVADGRSPTAVNWIRHFCQAGHEVYLVSTFACQPDLKLAGLEIVPVAFSGLKPTASTSAGRPLWSSAALSLRTRVRQWLGPLTIAPAARTLSALIQRIRPDLVHAMRIPYEGMLAADAYAGIPLVVSVWGNDFTLHARASALMAHYTGWVMKVADALHTDCERDGRLAAAWGFDPARPALVAPGNGGIRTDIFHPPTADPDGARVVNPRGMRAYVRNDVFFKAIPLVLRERPDARFTCLAMAGDEQALGWIASLGISHAVELLAPLPHADVARVLRQAQVVVSPSFHDGTPNSLLEAMACGCFPVAGDLESIREWITPGRNGLLVDPGEAQGLAGAVLSGLNNPALRQQAARLNAAIIAERAEYRQNMARAEAFYARVLSQARRES